jgi:hypothetical protein
MSSLLAGSDLIDGTMPAGSEWADQIDIRQSGVLKASRYSLGLFTKLRDRGQQEEIFGIDVGVARVLS